MAKSASQTGASDTEAPVLQLQDITQTHPGMTVFTGLDLSIRAGITALLGPNGAGKSTLLDIASLTSPPKQGAVAWRGHVLRRPADLRRARRGIAYLPQHFGFPGAYTATDVVHYAAWLRREPAPPRAREVLALVGLEDEASKKVSKMSGGMKQRLGIATCLVGNPELILLDEPTVGLDPAQRIQFRHALSQVGAAVVLSTHLVEDASVLADRILVLHQGRFVLDGSISELEDLGGTIGDSPAERGYMTLIGGKV